MFKSFIKCTVDFAVLCFVNQWMLKRFGVKIVGKLYLSQAVLITWIMIRAWRLNAAVCTWNAHLNSSTRKILPSWRTSSTINFSVKFSSMLETELTAPSSLFPEHCIPLAYQLPGCMIVVCIISHSTLAVIIFLSFISNTQHRMSTCWLKLNCICSSQLLLMYVMKRRSSTKRVVFNLTFVKLYGVDRSSQSPFLFSKAVREGSCLCIHSFILQGLLKKKYSISRDLSEEMKRM